MGDGTRIRFWHDRWCGELPLMERFPELYSCTADKVALVSSVLVNNLNGGGCSWNVRFLRDFHNWELETATLFLDFIYSHVPSGSGVRSAMLESTREW